MFLLVGTIMFWNFSSKVLKIYHQLFFNSENLLSSIDQCTGSFIQTFTTRWQLIMVLPLHLKGITWKRTVYIFSFYSFFKLLLFLLSLLLLLLLLLLVLLPSSSLLYCLIFYFIFKIRKYSVLVYNIITDL